MVVDSFLFPEAVDYHQDLHLSDGHTQTNAPRVMEAQKDLPDDHDQNAIAYWGSVHDEARVMFDKRS